MAKMLVSKAYTVAKYGGTVSAATTANGATDPSLLAEGALGIYGVNDVDASTTGNLDKLSLITLSTSAAGKTQDSEFLGKHIVIAQGTANAGYPVMSGPIEIAGIKMAKAFDYAAPAKQVLSIGYDQTYATAGLLNVDVDLTQNDELLIKMIRTEEGTQDRTPLNFPLTALVDDETQYSMMSRFATLIDSKGKDKLFVSDVKVTHNGTGSAFANSAIATVTNGSATVTTDANHGVDVGDYVSLGGALYKAITGTATTTLVLDRAYLGATGTVANASTIDLGATVPTQLGLRITAYDYNQSYDLVVDGGIVGSTITEGVVPSRGIGYGPDVAAMEVSQLPDRGFFDTVDANVKQPTKFVDSTKNYNLMFIDYINSNDNRAYAGGKTDSPLQRLTIAFIDEAITTGYNTDAMSIIKTLFAAATVIS